MKLRVSVGSTPGQGYSEPILTLSVEGKDYHTRKSAEELAKQINAKLDSLGFDDARRTVQSEAEGLGEKWMQCLLNRDSQHDADSLTKTVDALFEAIVRFGPGAIDLRNLPVDRVHGVHLAVALRATLSHKDKTPGWDEALTVARQALMRDGLDVEGALIGLL